MKQRQRMRPDGARSALGRYCGRQSALHYDSLPVEIHRWFAKQFNEAFAFPEFDRSRICVDDGKAQCATLPAHPDRFGETQNLRTQAPSLRTFPEQQ